MSVTTIGVGTGGSSYDVLVGRGLLGDPTVVTRLLPAGVTRVLVVHPEPMADLARRLGDAAEQAGVHAVLAAVPDAESAKTAEVAAGLWARLGQEGFTRTDAVVGVGGGTVTDLAGFVAATWLRGVAVVQVPTTLLAMVDAAVGGKTGINTAEGKNLVGAFHEPVGVVCDLDVLTTLPSADLAAGLAEVVKCGFVADGEILRLVEEDPADAADPAGERLRELVERAVRVKADVVTADLKESSLREVLNYGHTFGHAVEQVEGYTWRHGEAIAVGMVYVAELARRTGHLAEADVARHRAVLTSLGLPTSYAGRGSWEALRTAMGRDKKTRGDRLRFVVLDGLGRPTRLEGPAEADLEASYAAVHG